MEWFGRVIEGLSVGKRVVCENEDKKRAAPCNRGIGGI